MKKSIASLVVGLLLLAASSCRKYEAPYDTMPRPIDMPELVGYMGKTTDQVRSHLARTLLKLDSSEPAVDAQGQILPDRHTTVFAYDNARPAWAADDFTTFVLTDTLDRVNLVLVAREGMDHGGRLYLWELWRDYVAPYVQNGEWRTGVRAICENGRGQRFDRNAEGKGDFLKEQVQAFMAFYDAAESFNRLYFSLYAKRGKLSIHVQFSKVEYEGRPYYLHRIQLL